MQNPFRPAFGASPLVGAGRQTVISEFDRALSNGPGDPHRSVIISGSRGIAKTVLLTELEECARSQGWIVVRASGREGMTDVLTHSALPEVIEWLAPTDRRKITGVNIAGLGGIRSELTDSDVQPRLIARLRKLLAKLTDSGVLITIDEIQDADPGDLTQIALAMAGLTHGINRLLNLPGATFLRRARHYELGPLPLEDTTTTLIDTAHDAGRSFDVNEARTAAEISQGYPYLVQLVGYLAWEAAKQGLITQEAVESVRKEAIERLGTQVHQPSLRDVPLRQREYLDAMAHIEALEGSPSIATKDVAEFLGRPATSLSDTRAKLIDRDLIVPTEWGHVTFAQPYLGEFLRNQSRPKRIS
ncbi:ATP-binding protein [Corynebacterium cystitidis]|uniref:ATP-binding protein n=1 Tax=Corynebacterium cystitidis TaxID=35757 RepID=UPI00211EE872|nr:ATP-binding protein [Corynebacterium cystitidis]